MHESTEIGTPSSSIYLLDSVCVLRLGPNKFRQAFSIAGNQKLSGPNISSHYNDKNVGEHCSDLHYFRIIIYCKGFMAGSIQVVFSPQKANDETEAI